MPFSSTPIFIFEIFLCFLLSSIFLKKLELRNLSLFVFLFILFIVEYICAYLAFYDRPTNKVYSYWIPVEFSFYSLFIATFFLSKRNKYIIKISTIVYVTIVAFYYRLIWDGKTLSAPVYLAGCTLLIIVILLKISELLTEEIIQNPIKKEIFWFSIGLLFVSLSGFFHFGTANYLYENNRSLHNALQTLNVYFSIFQYLCFIVYFYCKWKFQK